MMTTAAKVILYASTYGRPTQEEFNALAEAVKFAIDGLHEQRFTPLRIVDRQGRVLLAGESILKYAHAHGL